MIVKHQGKIEKTCLTCGNTFFVFPCNENITKFCSHECYSNYPKQKERAEIKCLDCGKIFFVIPARINIAKYCSKYCANKHTLRVARERKVIEKQCLECGVTFYVTPAWKDRAKYCSKLCANKHVFIQNKKKEKTGIEKACGYCGKKYYVFKCNINKSKYCSKECRCAAMVGRIPHNKKEKISCTCKTCGVEFFVPECRKNEARFCSKKCFYEYPNRKKHQKKGIIITCVVCNKEFYVPMCRENIARFCSNECRVKYRKSEVGIVESKLINIGIKYDLPIREAFIKHKTESQYYCISCGKVNANKYFCALACFNRGYKYLPDCILRHLITVYEIQTPLGVLQGNGGLSLEARQRISNKHKGNTYSSGHTISDEQKAIWSIKNKERWKNPEFAHKILTTMGQSKEELVLDKILQENFPNTFKYVGNKAFQVGAKYPDFISIKDDRLIIELWGEHWHMGQNPQDRIDYFTNYGYCSLVIWAKELRKKDLLLQKINQFLQEVHIGV